MLTRISEVFWMPKCLQNHIKNVIDFGIDFGRVLASKTDSKMETKGDQTLGRTPFFALQNALKM